MPLRVLILYNSPTLPPEDSARTSEAGVLESVAAFENALKSRGHAADSLGLSWSIAELMQLSADRYDVVVNLVEGFAGKPSSEPYVAGLLELLATPYTGSTPDALALVRDKAKTKLLLLGAGLPTAPFRLIETADPFPRDELAAMSAAGPLMVKPAAEDASLGVGAESVVTDPSALEARFDYVRAAFGPVLVERYIAGREFNVGVFALPTPTALPIAEVVFRDDPALAWPILTYDAKWNAGSAADLASPVKCPAEIDGALGRRLTDLAIAAFRATGCRDYSRVDFRVTPAGEPFILEVNGNPDLGPTAGFARGLGAAKIDYNEFVERLVEFASRRSAPRKPSGAKKPKTPHDGSFRKLAASDKPAILEVLHRTGVFRPHEVEVAAEIIDESVGATPDEHYQHIVLEAGGRLAGWSCYGRVPMTEATFDLYWIAVDPARHGGGLGRRLLEETERRARDAGGRWLIAETSDTPIYRPTQEFYRRSGYHQASHIRDYYRTGDGLLVFAKRL